MQLAIDISGLSKRFGEHKPSLEGLDLAVPVGAVYGFVGPNGAGKTTTLRTLLGLVRPDSGRVRVLGLDPAVDARGIRSRVGVLLESDGLYDRLSALRNLDFHARIHRLDGAARQRRVQEVLEQLQLWERRGELVVTWSKGMRQRLAVARAMLHQPQLLLLDEPFSGLDPEAAVELRRHICALALEQGTTVFLTTHDLTHVERACSEVAVVREGRVVAVGTPEQLSSSGSLEMEVCGEGLTDTLLAALLSEGLLLSYDHRGRVARLRCLPEAKSRIGPELVRRGVLVESLTLTRRSLEDAFISLMQADGAGSR